jgi:hypothetical protein
MASEGSSGPRIDEKQVDGVWLFWRVSRDHFDALLTGPVSIVDGCLKVGGYVVIWDETWLAVVEAAVDAVAGGDSPEFSVGGGEWGAPLPAAIEARCGAAAVWIGSPVE